MNDEHNFQALMGDVKPLKSQNDKVMLNNKPSENKALQAKRAAAEGFENIDENQLTTEAVDLVHPDDILEYKKDGIQQGVYKNLRLGKYELHATLNLHGKSVAESRLAVFQFINDCQKANLRSLLIQHGKGIKSQPHQAIIKSYVNKWLPTFDSILAFHSALPQHGGTGAIYVLLKKSEQARLANKEQHQKRSKG